MELINPNFFYYPLKKSFPYIKGGFRKPFIYLNSLLKQRKFYLKGINQKSNQLRSKFFVVCIPRSGSMLLGSSLASNSNIHWDNEKFRFNAFLPNLLANGMANKKNVLCYGVKLFLTEMNSGDKYVDAYLNQLERMHKDGWKFISLIRENSLKQAISFYKFIEDGKGYVLKTHNKNDKKKIYINTDELSEIIQWCEAFKELQKRMMKRFPHLGLSYEADLSIDEKRQETMNVVFNFLNVPASKTYTRHVKQSPRKLIDQIENYDEFLSFVNEHGYEKYL